jgi:FAD/FMN-containing dehydrogenase
MLTGTSRAELSTFWSTSSRPGFALPRSTDEVSAVVRSAAADGKRVAAQRTGHNAEPLGSLANTVLLRTDGLGGVQIDADAGAARVGSGALWGDLLPRASDLGLAALHGSAPDVGIAGYTLGGGVSFYHRKHGLACNRVTAIELVIAGGEQIRVDADNEPDLFWALRGGGGSFGVVTALEFDLLPLSEIFAGALLFPAEQASEVLQGWREWTSGMPEAMTSVGRLMNFPPIPEMPEPLRGRSFAVLEVIYCGDVSDGDELVAPLRKLGSAAMDTIQAEPPAGIAELHMEPPTPVPYTSESLLTHELPASAIDSLVKAVGPGSGSQLASVELRHGWGALSRAPQDAGALATLPGSFITFAVGFVPAPEAMAPNRAWLGAYKAALEPYDAGNYFNFVEYSFDITQIFPPGILDRLREVKQHYDPENLFQSNHPVTA